jgi:hypothetical protein
MSSHPGGAAPQQDIRTDAMEIVMRGVGSGGSVLRKATQLRRKAVFRELVCEGHDMPQPMCNK